MIGVSYNGTLPNQVATTGVEGLETIVPISAISSWYDYYRANGLVRAPHSQTQGVGDNAFQGEDTDVLGAYTGGPRMTTRQCAGMMAYLNREQDRVTGDFSRFWWERDYMRRVRGVESSVFIVHGLNDWECDDEGFAEVVVPPRRPPRAAQAVAPQRRPRRREPEPETRPTSRSTSGPRTAGSTTSCSACGTGSSRSRGRASSARTGPTSTRPTGRCPAPAARGSASPPTARRRPASCPRARGAEAATRASSTAVASWTRTTS